MENRDICSWAVLSPALRKLAQFSFGLVSMVLSCLKRYLLGFTAYFATARKCKAATSDQLLRGAPACAFGLDFVCRASAELLVP